MIVDILYSAIRKQRYCHSAVHSTEFPGELSLLQKEGKLGQPQSYDRNHSFHKVKIH